MKNNIFKQWIMAGLLCILSSSAFSDVEYSGIAFSNVDIHGQGIEADVKPGETIGIHAHYKWLWPREEGSIVQIIVGLDGIGAQTSIANGLVIGNRYFDHLSLFFGGQYIDITEQDVDFSIVAPKEPGTYQVRFRYAQAYTHHEAVAEWWNVDQAPTDEATIGTITVR